MYIFQLFSAQKILSLITLLLTISCASTIRTYEPSPLDGLKTDLHPNYLTLSYQLLENLQAKKDVSGIQEKFAESTRESIMKQIVTDGQKIAFWVNIYNAYIQIILKAHPEYYENRSDFFGKAQINIAGRTFSFNEIEHGIIRRSQIPFGLGLIRNPFAPKYERQLRVSQRDARIHFALNCGAKSCPPVAVYHPETLDEELDFMSTEYLKDHTEYDLKTGTATTTALFSWFRGDFRGKRGIKNMLFNYGVTSKKPRKIKFKSYDWTLYLENYREIE